jgi:glycosyltransferase involved in cell wall biosynthesis
MKLSFVIPAFNEAGYIEQCLAQLAAVVAKCRNDSGRDELGQNDLSRDEPGRDEPGAAFETEYVVVDNNSTDETAQRAEQAGARVVFEPVNQISRARNAGAKAAGGDWLIFVDADSEVSAGLLGEVLALIESGEYIGCGALMTMNDMPRAARWMLVGWTWLSTTLNWAAGSFVVCRADAFTALGGFSEQLFAAEEIDFSRRIKKYARRHHSKFVVLRKHPLQTSNRKVRLYSDKELLAQMLRLLFRPRKTLHDKAALDVWYDGRR